MAKISPVSIKYMIHANFSAEGALEKPDVIGAVFGQTEGLLGSDLEMRELQKEGKIGRIEVQLEKDGKRTVGKIQIPTALDQSETTLIAAAIETIERIGPCDSSIEIERIEDVRGSKRDYIIERAKKLMQSIEGSTDSREISNVIKDSTKMGDMNEFGGDSVACGDLSGPEIIIVEGRADVVNLLKNGINNVVAMNGTKLPKGIGELSKKKEVTLYVDGDRGGKLIIQNVTENADVDYITTAPDGKEVEELSKKEILINLRKKVKASEFLAKMNKKPSYGQEKREYSTEKTSEKASKIELSSEDREKLKEISNKNEGSGKAIFLDENLKELGSVSAKTISGALRRLSKKPSIIVIDGTANGAILNAAEEAGCSIVAASKFTTTDTKVELLSL